MNHTYIHIIHLYIYIYILRFAKKNKANKNMLCKLHIAGNRREREREEGFFFAHF